MSAERRLSDGQYRDASKFNARIYLHSRFRTNPVGWPTWLFDQLKPSNEMEVLELGCGTGLVWLANAQRIPASWKLVLTDSSPGMVEEAKQKLRDLPCRVDYAVMDAQKITFGDGSFDVVVANNMLYHVPDRDKAIAEARRVLRSHGTFYATTASLNNMLELKSLMREFRRREKLARHAADDQPIEPVVGGFSLESGAAQLRSHFRNVEMRTYLDSLEVTEAQAIVDYFLSLNNMHGDSALLPEDQIPLFLAFVADKMLPQGKISVSKQSGMFVCR